MANTLGRNPAAVSYSNATSVAVDMGSGGTNPSLIVAALTRELLSATATVADTVNSGNYTEDIDGSGGNGGTGSGRAGVFSKQNTSTATTTVTATLSAASYGLLRCWEIVGAPTTAAFDVGASNGGTSTTRTLSMTLGGSNSTVVAVGTAYPNAFAVDTNYTNSYGPTAGSNAYHYGEHRVDAGSAGGITLSFGASANSDNWVMTGAAYKTAGAGPSTRIKDILGLDYIPKRR